MKALLKDLPKLDVSPGEVIVQVSAVIAWLLPGNPAINTLIRRTRAARNTLLILRCTRTNHKTGRRSMMQLMRSDKQPSTTNPTNTDSHEEGVAYKKNRSVRRQPDG
jgi:hypothetical protein